MKTAMQELIEFVKDERFAHSNYTIELKAIELLEKEKEQIINAHVFGWSDGFDLRENKQSRLATEYYNETYNQNK
jgi:hypothetical protein